MNGLFLIFVLLLIISGISSGSSSKVRFKDKPKTPRPKAPSPQFPNKETFGAMENWTCPECGRTFHRQLPMLVSTGKPECPFCDKEEDDENQE